MTHRVLTTPAFWAALEHELPGDSEPAWHQFASYDLQRVIGVFRDAWDGLPHTLSPDYRTAIGAGSIGWWAATGQWERDLAEIHLVDITVQAYPPDMFEISGDV
ncbi:hypothetical protein KIH74_22790 [Kineosporia sp. J2-2]|uniref:DUF4240 domain-containing protein n=1 Tax=Kineosporia corallincola TaxID=2835133 RepID=A0ABS5TL32_9ACTN|nr:hypothetical protein [Kineosporia corallincola]MBT0771786.1 hypothetical protein [Kineosporia corallincola]